MTVEEFSNEFDTLVSSYRRFKKFDDLELLDSIEFNEYEKSIFLTKAQEEIVKALYTNKYTGDSFENTEEVRRQLESIVKLIQYTECSTGSLLSDQYTHSVYNLPSDCWYIVYEQVSWTSENSCLTSKIADVIPVTHDDYWRTKNNPFRGPNTKKVLRLDNSNLQVELVSDNTIGTYLIRYISKPEPIILAILPDESIDGINTILTCKLAESLHRGILERAVQMALSTKINTNNNKDKD